MKQNYIAAFLLTAVLGFGQTPPAANPKLPFVYTKWKHSCGPS